MSRDVTVCHNMHFWLQHLALVLFAVSLALAVGQPWAFPDGRPVSFDTMQTRLEGTLSFCFLT